MPREEKRPQKGTDGAHVLAQEPPLGNEAFIQGTITEFGNFSGVKSKENNNKKNNYWTPSLTLETPGIPM